MRLAKRKFTLIAAFILVVGILMLLTAFLRPNKQQFSQQLGSHPLPTPMFIQFNPNLTTSNLFITQKDNQSVHVVIDTDNKPITAVQFEISYDPDVLQGLQITPGSFFSNPIVLQNQIDEKNGVMLYAIAVKPQEAFPQGKGIVATISYTINPGVAGQTTLHFLPLTKVTSANIDQSVLKKITDFTMPTVQ